MSLLLETTVTRLKFALLACRPILPHTPHQYTTHETPTTLGCGATSQCDLLVNFILPRCPRETVSSPPRAIRNKATLIGERNIFVFDLDPH